jgi:hypothetical protein
MHVSELTKDRISAPRPQLSDTLDSGGSANRSEALRRVWGTRNRPCCSGRGVVQVSIVHYFVRACRDSTSSKLIGHPTSRSLSFATN